MRNTIPISAAAIILILGLNSSADDELNADLPDGSAFLSLKVTPSAREFKMAEPILLRVEAKNLTNEAVQFFRHPRKYSAFGIAVVDDVGWKSRDSRYSGFGYGEVLTESIATKDSYVAKFNISAIKDMTSPGEYTIDIWLHFQTRGEHAGMYRVRSRAKVKVVDQWVNRRKVDDDSER